MAQIFGLLENKQQNQVCGLVTEKQNLNIVTVLLTIPCLMGKDVVVAVITEELHSWRTDGAIIAWLYKGYSLWKRKAKEKPKNNCLWQLIRYLYFIWLFQN